VRVTLAEINPIANKKTNKTNLNLLFYIIISCVVVAIVLFYLKFINFNTGLRRQENYGANNKHNFNEEA
jgi:uncharacterized membrane protein